MRIQPIFPQEKEEEEEEWHSEKLLLFSEVKFPYGPVCPWVVGRSVSWSVKIMFQVLPRNMVMKLPARPF